MDFLRYDPKKGDYFNQLYQSLPLYFKMQLAETNSMVNNPKRIIQDLLIFNWASALVKRRLTENQMYIERDKVLNASPTSDVEMRNNDYAYEAYSKAIHYRHYLDEKILKRHPGIVFGAKWSLLRLAERIGNSLRTR